ncbi:MAG: tail fiber domain-containing protein [Patescibacteria group bacterium]|nr:tail fiber domain-containing protein [Patescibacteria group bacterium]
MSGSVWFLTARKKKIEFKRYPAKKHKKKIKKKNKGKKILVSLSLALILILISSFISAAITDDLHLNIQTTYSNGTIQTGTFAFAFNISTSSTCSPVVYSNLTSLTTDSRGIISYYLPAVTLDYDIQYWLCYYRDGTLINNSKLARVPYAFRATDVNLSEVEVDTNLTMPDYNITADYGFFSYLGSLVSRITGLFVTDLDVSNNLTVGGNLSVGTDTLFVDSNLGRVGIGTASPSAFLSIRNDASTNAIFVDKFGSEGTELFSVGTFGNIQGGATWLAQKLSFNDNVLTLQNLISGKSALRIRSANGQTADIMFVANWNEVDRYFTIDADGDVGIGTATPQNTLNVLGDANVTANFSVDNNVLFVDSNNDKVGIGTSSPGSKLEVNGTTGIKLTYDSSNFGKIFPQSDGDMTLESKRRFDLFGTGGQGSQIALFNGTTQLSSIGHDAVGMTIYNEVGIMRLQSRGTDGRLILGTTDVLNALTIVKDGSVGVNDAAPAFKLEVNGKDTSGYFGLSNAVDGDVFVVDENENVGINTSTPQNTLNVIGDANITGTLYYGTLDGEADLNVNDSSFLDGYDSTFFAPLNKSLIGNFNITGSLNIDGSWQDGGVTIDGGDIFAQTIYVYDIIGLNVSDLNINGSLLPAAGFDNTFDLGSASLRWRSGFFGTSLNVNGTGYFGGDVGIGTSSPGHELEVASGTTSTSLMINADGYTPDRTLTLTSGISQEITGTNSLFLRPAGAIVFDPQDDRVLLGDTGDNVDLLVRDGGVCIDDFDCTAPADGNLIVSGQVGIGMTSPDTTLHIHEGSSAANFLKITNTGTGEGATDGFIIGIGADETAQIWQYENLDMLFGTNNVEKMRIEAGGNVGIGTTGPNSTLEVINGTTQGGFMVSSDSQGAGDLFIVDESGRVGIGTSSPDEVLEIVGSAKLTASTSGQVNLTFGIDGTDFQWIEYDDSTGDLVFKSNTGTRDVVFNQGNVGIGTSSPGYPLEVNGQADVDILSIGSNHLKFYEQTTDILGYTPTNANKAGTIRMFASGNSGSFLQLFSTNYGADTTNFETFQLRFPYAGDAILTVGKGGTGTYRDLGFETGGTRRMTIDTSGNVGIGTSSPSNKLQVEFSGDNGLRINGTDSHASLYIDSGGASFGNYIRFSQAGTNKYWINGETDGDLAFRPLAGTAAVTFTEAGDVGIGTGSPAALLHTNTSGQNYLKVETTGAASQAALQLKTGTANADWITYIPGSSTELRFYRGTDRMVLDASGNLQFDGTLTVSGASGTIAGSTIYHAGNDPLDTIAEWDTLCTDCVGNDDIGPNAVDLTSDALSTAYAGVGIGGGGTAALSFAAADVDGTCLTGSGTTLSVTADCIDDAQVAANALDATSLAANSVAASEFNEGDATLENEIEAMIFDSDAQSVPGVWTWGSGVNLQFADAGTYIDGTTAVITIDGDDFVQINADNAITLNAVATTITGIGVVNGLLEAERTTDATGTAGTGAAEFGGTLRIDGNEIITNTGMLMALQNDNNGDLQVDAGTIFVDASLNLVGIGMTEPDVKLDVALGSNTDGIRLRGSDETNQIVDMFIGTQGAFIIDLTVGTETNKYISLRPKSPTHGFIIRESDGTGIITYANFYVVDAADDYLSINVNSAVDGDALIVTAANEVGIGTSNPTAKLEVAGTFKTSSTVHLTGIGETSSGVYMRWFNGGVYRLSSSSKFKENITDLEEDYYKILDARPVSFIDKTTKERQIGYIAEEFEELELNNIVNYDINGTVVGLEYDKVALYLKEIVKDHEEKISEQQNKTEQQQSNISQLKLENEQIKTELEDIKKQIEEIKENGVIVNNNTENDSKTIDEEVNNDSELVEDSSFNLFKAIMSLFQ